MNITSRVGMGGTLTVRKIACPKAPLSWRWANCTRKEFIWGWLVTHLARLFSRLTGVMTLTSKLSIRVKYAKAGWVDYGIVGYRVITTVGAGAVADDFTDASADVTNFKYHGAGTVNAAEAVGDTSLGAESTTALNPDNTRATGTNTNPSAKVYQSVGTLTFDGAALLLEHGVFSASAVNTGVIFDRTTHGLITVGAGDSVQYTYQGTFNDGG